MEKSTNYDFKKPYLQNIYKWNKSETDCPYVIEEKSFSWGNTDDKLALVYTSADNYGMKIKQIVFGACFGYVF